MSNAYLRYLHGAHGETWAHALERFASFCTNLREFTIDGDTYEAFFDEYYHEGALFERLGAVEDSALEEAEARFHFTMSSEFKKLFRNRFAIYDVSIEFGRWGERRLLEINGVYKLTTCLHPFCDAIAWNFGSYFADSELTEHQIKQLNETYFGFGRYSNDDHHSIHLLVDRHGGFGCYEFHTEDYPGSLQRLAPLLSGERLTMSLDEVLIWAIDESMKSLLERNEIPDNEG